MTSLAINVWARLRPVVGFDPGRWAAGSAISDPFALLAASHEGAAERARPANLRVRSFVRVA